MESHPRPSPKHSRVAISVAQAEHPQKTDPTVETIAGNDYSE